MALLLCACTKPGYRGTIDLGSQGASDIQTVNLAAPESWGRWTDGSPVVIRLNQALPAHFRLRIMTTQSFGPNVGKMVVVTIGDQSWQFKALAAKQMAETEFLHVPAGTHLIRLTIPAPVSPHALGISADSRELGLGLAKLEITPLD